MALAGLAAYSAYVDSTKDQAVLSDGHQVQKMIDLSLLHAMQHSPDDTCADVLDAVVVNLISQNKTNPFTGAFLVQSATASGALKRGSIYLACLVPSAKVGDTGFYLQNCVCTGEDCPLQPLPGLAQTLSTQVCYAL